MPQRDLLAELRAAHVAAPPEVRERIRLIALEAPGPGVHRRFTWRRAAVVAVPVAAALAAAVVLGTRPSHHNPPRASAVRGLPAHGAIAPQEKAFSVPVTPKRVQTVGATLSLRVRSVSRAVQRAVAIAGSLSGYASSVHAQTHGAHGTATLTLKIPRTHVQAAIRRLSALGTITSESIDLTDRQAGLNADERRIARLRAQLAGTTDPKRRAAITARIQALQRQDASTRRAAHYATLHLRLATPAAVTHPSRVWRDVAWAGGGAAALAVLLLAVHLARRVRENRLLSRS
ncbi:MAG TPA: DUF4349 domain-containing protein [Gaiellaceae bacterium]|nr:DUF4349 domain-containing protein [Gaiellaceae bacterium]